MTNFNPDISSFNVTRAPETSWIQGAWEKIDRSIVNYLTIDFFPCNAVDTRLMALAVV